MKTAEAFYKEITASKELQEELNSLNEAALGEFLKKHDCEATAKEFAAFLRTCDEGEIEDSEAAAAAGGMVDHIPREVKVHAPV